MGPCHTDTEKQVEKLLSHNKELEEEVQEMRQSHARTTTLFEEGVIKHKVGLTISNFMKFIHQKNLKKSVIPVSFLFYYYYNNNCIVILCP